MPSGRGTGRFPPALPVGQGGEKGSETSLRECQWHRCLQPSTDSPPKPPETAPWSSACATAPAPLLRAARPPCCSSEGHSGVSASPWAPRAPQPPAPPLTCIFCSPSRFLAKPGRLVCTTGFFICGEIESGAAQNPAPVWGTSSPPAPHLLLEAPVVHLVHSAAGKGLQVLPALAAEEPHVSQVGREVAQAFLEISRVLCGSDKGFCRALSNPSTARESPCRCRQLWLEPALTLGVFRCSSRS